MFKKLHILFLLTATFALVLPITAQNEKVCIGSKVMYRTDGLNGSIYNYKLDQTQSGKIIQTYSDSIIVQWSDLRGVFQLGVRETSQYGCEGGWAYLNVEVVGDSAKFTQSTYSTCGGSGVLVEFNKTDFKAYEWVDKQNVSIDGYISKPGRYELRTIDRNNCLLSSHVNIVQSPMPRVNLGKADTLICTPGFRLYALEPNTNPSGTVFTWSTGASGTSPFIDVEDHDKNKDIIYWVRADLGECSASDTIVVLACKELPETLGIPNTITPNGDGDNDVWNISALQPYPDCTVEIFDRWGRKVFTSAKGYSSNPWNGRDAKGHYLPMETYYYIIHLNDGKSSKPILGTITIIR